MGTYRAVPGSQCSTPSAHARRPRLTVCVTRPAATRPSYTLVSDALWCVAALHAKHSTPRQRKRTHHHICSALQTRLMRVVPIGSKMMTSASLPGATWPLRG
jgi:hypothetical protein